MTEETVSPSKEITIVNKRGIHARPAAKLVRKASRFRSEILLKRETEVINAKSIMGVMTLTAAFGDKITIEANGPDSETAVAELEALINNKFDEPE